MEMELKNLEEKYEALGKEIEKIKMRNAVGFADDPIFLLSEDEFCTYREKILEIAKNWFDIFWLRSPSAGNTDHTRYVNPAGAINGTSVYYFLKIVPVLNLTRPGILDSHIEYHGEDRLVYCGTTWVRIDGKIFMVENPISFRQFDSHSNCYKTSEIRKWLLTWHFDRKGW